MKNVSVLVLSGLTLAEVFVNVSPNRAQFFTGESVSLSCDGVQGSAEWTLKRGRNKKNETCGPVKKDFGLFDGSSCIMSNLSPESDSGSYWCEDGAGQKSPKVDIHVSVRQNEVYLHEMESDLMRWSHSNKASDGKEQRMEEKKMEMRKGKERGNFQQDRVKQQGRRTKNKIKGDAGKEDVEEEDKEENAEKNEDGEQEEEEEE
ncbi:hypothetical protein Q5P01_003146 [Channa striata]|uniref:Ig-like domain-containing protein n=1 Tax=Channa striata TaxID=64152 RepID=A0AA88T6W9_CHASR|nr:hypothetical protein Q5P01_003146 [Channa striata]